MKTYSRAHVSNDNPFIESYFGTMKTNIKYPKNGFATKAEVEKWIGEFIQVYNNTKHSGINYASPNQRYGGVEKYIIAHGITDVDGKPLKIKKEILPKKSQKKRKTG